MALSSLLHIWVISTPGILVAQCTTLPAFSFLLYPPLVPRRSIVNIELGLITTRDIAYRAMKILVYNSLLSAGVGLWILLCVLGLLRCLEKWGGVFSLVSGALPLIPEVLLTC